MNGRLLSLSILFFFALSAKDSFSATPPLEVEVVEQKPEEKFIVVITASYNNARYYKQNIDSVMDQEYENYHLIYVDDCSTDGTYNLVKTYIESIGAADRVTLIKNDTRIGAMANQYHAIHQCPDRAIIAIVDGDDRLANSKVFDCLNKKYSKKEEKIWLTYGQFRVEPGGQIGWCRPIPLEYVQRNAFRDYKHNLSHLRTFYAGLFKQIKKEDLMLNGSFLQMCADNGAMFPMAEMAREHMCFIPDVLLVWNGHNELNDHKTVRGLQRQLDLVVRSLPRYEKIESPFLASLKDDEEAYDLLIGKTA